MTELLRRKKTIMSTVAVINQTLSFLAQDRKDAFIQYGLAMKENDAEEIMKQMEHMVMIAKDLVILNFSLMSLYKKLYDMDPIEEYRIASGLCYSKFVLAQRSTTELVEEQSKYN